MMKKMQAQLNKQYKLDKKVQKAKEKVKKAERLEREERLQDQQRKMKELVVKEQVTEPDYTFTSSASLYKDEKAEKERESHSLTPDSPHRILTLGLKDDDYYFGRFM